MFINERLLKQKAFEFFGFCSIPRKRTRSSKNNF